MATQQQIIFSAGEDVIDTLSVYNSDGVSTVDLTGSDLTLYARRPGGALVLSLASPTYITAALPLPYQASVTFPAAGTASISAGYYDLSIWRTNTGGAAEFTVGTLMLNPPRPG